MGELLLHPTRQVGSRHATHATATRHGRHGAPARHVGRRVTRQAAAVTQHSAQPGGPPADGHAAAGDDQAKSIREKKASLRHGKIANPPRGNCGHEFIRLTPPQSAGTARNRRPTRPRLQRGSAPAGRGPAPPGWSPATCRARARSGCGSMLFSGRFKGVLARARGTWAGVVLGHKAAVLGVMPQVGQPHCGIVSKSTVPGGGRFLTLELCDRCPVL